MNMISKALLKRDIRHLTLKIKFVEMELDALKDILEEKREKYISATGKYDLTD